MVDALTEHILAVLIGVELPGAEDLAHDGLLVRHVNVVRGLARPETHQWSNFKPFLKISNFGLHPEDQLLSS